MPGNGHPSLSLRVTDAPLSAAAGTARLPHVVMTELDVRPGDPVEIIGRGRTVALASAVEDGDDATNFVALSAIQRSRARVEVGEQVEVRPLTVSPAEYVVIGGEPEACASSATGALRQRLVGRIIEAGDALDAGDDGADCAFAVISTTPEGAVRVAEDTIMEFLPRKASWVAHRSAVILEDVSALGPFLNQLREVIELPLRRPEVFERLGVAPHRGILLKSVGGLRNPRLSKAVAVEFGVSLFSVTGSELASLGPEEAERRLAGLFQGARGAERPVVFIDELHVIAPAPTDGGGAPARLKARLLSLMDGIAPEDHLIVVGATHRPDQLDPEVREPGRFDREIFMGPPDLVGRREFLALSTRGMPLADDVDLIELSEFTAGYTRENLAMLVREAALEVAGRIARDEIGAESEPAGMTVRRSDFLKAMKWISPSALHEISVGVPVVTWNDVGTLGSVKNRLRRGIVLPMKGAAEIARLGLRPARGFLLFGPPGNGKSLLAAAAAQEAGASLLSAGASTLLATGGDEAQLMASLFARAREVAPAMIFIDELDRLTAPASGAPGDTASARRLLNALFAQFDAAAKAPGVVVVGATWRPNLLEADLLRAGRFEEIVYVPVPDRAARRHVLEILTRAMPLASDVDFEAIAAETDLYTGADLQELVRAAGLLSLDRAPGSPGVDASCFWSAIEESRASVTPAMERAYEEIALTLKQEPPHHFRVGFATRQEEA